MKEATNTIKYKGYTIYLRRDSQTKRINGAFIIQLDGMFCETLTRAKRIINIMTETN